MWRYEYKYGGKRKTLALGKDPIRSLGEARRARDDAKEQLEKRIDPSQSRKLEKLGITLAAANTFGLIAEEWLQKIGREGRADVTLTKARWFAKLLAPSLGCYGVRVQRQPATGHALHVRALVHRLAIKPDSPFYAWLDREIARRFDYACAETLDAFRREERAVTRTGQTKARRTPH